MPTNQRKEKHQKYRSILNRVVEAAENKYFTELLSSLHLDSGDPFATANSVILLHRLPDSGSFLILYILLMCVLTRF